MPTPILPAEAPIATSPSLVSSSNRCAKCGTIKKSGKRSCCARGGAWFKNCGDAGETPFGHTWAEGVQACKGFPSFASADPSLQVLLNAGTIVYPLNTAEPRKQKTNDSRADSIANTLDSSGVVGIAKDAVCVCVLFIILRFQM